MSVGLKQLRQEGATDGQSIVWNNSSGEYESGDASITTFSADDGAIDLITSGTDVLVDTMTITPGVGDYLVSFSTSANLGSNNTAADFSIYVNGIQEANSIRSIARGGGATSGHVHGVSIASYKVTGVLTAQAIEIRASVSGGTLSVFERNLTLLAV